MAFMGIFYAGMGAGAWPEPRAAKWSTGENFGEIWGKTSGIFSVVRSFVCWFVVLLRFWSDIEIEPQYLRCFTQKICGGPWVKNSADPSNAWRDFSWRWSQLHIWVLCGSYLCIWSTHESGSPMAVRPDIWRNQLHLNHVESCWIMSQISLNHLRPYWII